MPLDIGNTLLIHESAAPATPAAGRTGVYSKVDGLLYSKDDAGVEQMLSGVIEGSDFSMTGTLVVKNPGTSRIYMEYTGSIETVRASVNTAPTGATVIVDVRKNGTTIYTGGTGRPAIAISGNTATGNSPAVNTFSAGDYLTVDVVQIGSTVAGADLTVTVRTRRTA